jgi:hypothetical protein
MRSHESPSPSVHTRALAYLIQSAEMTQTKTHRHVDLQAGVLERQRRRARARSANATRRAMRARRSVVG